MVRFINSFSVKFLFVTFCLVGILFNRSFAIDTITTKKNNFIFIENKLQPQKIIIKTSPTSLAFGGVFPFTNEYRICAETNFYTNQTDQISVSYLGKNFLIYFIENTSRNVTTSNTLIIRGFRLQYTHKFFLPTGRKKSPFGLYFGPNVSYSEARMSVGLDRYYKRVYYEFKYFSFNLTFGYQVCKQKHFVFEIYDGVGYSNNKIYYHYNSANVVSLSHKDIFGRRSRNLESHLNIVFGMHLGYVF